MVRKVNREVRTIRPFQVEDALAQILDDVVLRFGSEECTAKGRIEIDDPNDYRRRPAEIIWASEFEFDYFKSTISRGITNLGIDPRDVSLLITASSSYLRITEIIFDHPISALKRLPIRVNLINIKPGDLGTGPFVNLSNPRPKALSTGFHGGVITAYLLLTKDIERHLLRPWRKGTWLARARFRLSRSQTSLFRLTPLNDEQRTKLGLPKAVARYLDMSDHEPLQNYDNTYPPTFYVDEELLAMLNAQPNSKLSRFLQIQLVQDFILGVINSPAVQEEDSTDLDWEDLANTLVGRILNLVTDARASAVQRMALFKEIRNDPSRVAARVEAAIGLRKELLGALAEEQT